MLEENRTRKLIRRIAWHRKDTLFSFAGLFVIRPRSGAFGFDLLLLNFLGCFGSVDGFFAHVCLEDRCGRLSADSDQTVRYPSLSSVVQPLTSSKVSNLSASFTTSLASPPHSSALSANLLFSIAFVVFAVVCSNPQPADMQANFQNLSS